MFAARKTGGAPLTTQPPKKPKGTFPKPTHPSFALWGLSQFAFYYSAEYTTRMIYYSSQSFYATSAATSGAAPTWTNAASGTGAPDGSRAFSAFTGSQNGAILYCSGFAPNLNARANIASGFLTVVHRQPSGTAGNGSILQFYHGTGLNIPTATGDLFSVSSLTLPTGTTFRTLQIPLPTSLLTPSILNDPSFFLGIRYASEATISVDVDSIYLTLVYDVAGTPFYKTGSIFRCGANFRYK